MKKCLLFIVAVFMLTPVLLDAQQIVDFTSFRENAFAFNPALAGSERATFGQISGRTQWSDIRKSPFTANLFAHTRVDRKNIGYGGYILNDFTGPSSYTALNFSFAYHIVFSEYRSGLSEYKALSFGLSASVVQHRLNGNEIILDQPVDESISRIKGTQFFPDAAFGMHYRSKTIFASASIPQLLHLNVSIDGINGNVNRFRKLQHYYLMFGGRIYSKKKQNNKYPFYVEPAFNMHYVIGAPPQGVVSMRFYMEDLFFVGAGYRSLSSVIFEGGVTVSKKFSIFYAYDFETTSNVRTSAGQVHEIGMSFLFNKDIFYK